MSSILSSVQFDLSQRFHTGNPLYDAFISSAIFSSGSYVFSLLMELNQRIKNFIVPLALKASFYLKHIIQRRKTVITKSVSIDYISDNKQINELYKAVQAYLACDTNLDFTHEPELKLTYEKKIEHLSQLDGLVINKMLPHYQQKDFTFKGHQITYSNTKGVINVYTDKKRERENFTITLSTQIPTDSHYDVLEDFCHNCMYEYAKSLLSKKWVQQIYVNKNKQWTTQPSNNKRKVDTIILKNGLKKEIMSDLDLFLHSEDWYNVRDIPYTRGYLFYGPPGTGKTSMIKGLSTYCRRHIHYLVLNDIKDDTELINLMKDIDYHETIVVIEDIDCTIESIKSRQTPTDSSTQSPSSSSSITIRQSSVPQCSTGTVSESPTNDVNKLTLSGLLNVIDGIFNHDGRILIMTTNHPEILDKALIRPGRIDRKFFFENCDKKQIGDLFEMFFNVKCDSSLMNEIKDESYSPAHVSSVFLRYRNNPIEAIKQLDQQTNIE